MYILIPFLIVVLLVYWAFEYSVNRHHLSAMSYRILVNGTRGKSSVTRLIAAGIRAGGIKTYAKTTGTLPRMIDDLGTEHPFERIGPANIREIKHFIATAHHNGAQAVVVECMAVQPRLQETVQDRFVQSNIGVITNARADHLDVMGPSVKDVALNLSKTTPKKGILFTAESEREWQEIFRQRCKELGSELEIATGNSISSEVLQGFKYVEHPDNVALALAVCEYIGVPKPAALEAMYQTFPDPGVLRLATQRNGNKEIVWINAMAANDPDSTVKIWNILGPKYIQDRDVIVLVNTRKDRIHRSLQLAEMIACCVPAKYYMIIGSSANVVYLKAMDLGVPKEFLIALGETDFNIVVNELWRLASSKTTVFAVGNIAKEGLELTSYFQGADTVNA